MRCAKITGEHVRRPKTLQSKASAPGGLKNPSRSFAPWRAAMRRLWRKRSFAERSNCQLASNARERPRRVLYLL